MGKEIERKFLVRSNAFVHEAARALGCEDEPSKAGKYYRQGYIPTLNGITVRIRIAGNQGFATFKDHAINFSRHEFEYEIPLDDATQMLELMCDKPQIEKYRYIIPVTTAEGLKLKWEVDVFCGDNEGLIVAEIELPEESTPFELPDWIGEEVTGHKKYYNSHLTRNPYKNWKE